MWKRIHTNRVVSKKVCRQNTDIGAGESETYSKSPSIKGNHFPNSGSGEFAIFKSIVSMATRSKGEARPPPAVIPHLDGSGREGLPFLACSVSVTGVNRSPIGCVLTGFFTCNRLKHQWFFEYVCLILTIHTSKTGKNIHFSGI